MDSQRYPSTLKENMIDLTTLESQATVITTTTTHQVMEDPIPVHDHDEGKRNTSIPVVKLQVDSISDTLAARLAASLLAMVLFLKNQVPLPVPQLVRLSGRNSSPKATKQRAELLNAYDTLTSHLMTTFSALSMALAQNCEKNDEALSPTSHRAYLAILLGPSLGTAKAKVFLGVDHLAGAAPPEAAARIESKREVSKGSDGDEDSDDSASEGDTSGEHVPGESDSENEDEAERESSESDVEPECSGLKLPPPIDRPRQVLQASQPKLDARSPRLTAPPPISYADEQRFLQNADRLLSRTLAAADAEGYGFASDMAVTQTHVLIRAPRNFSHPAWIPRQNVTSTLETGLRSFLDESRCEPPTEITSPAKSSKKQNPEGVWLTTKNGSMNLGSKLEGDDSDMIWWSWDGKLVGFSDW